MRENDARSAAPPSDDGSDGERESEYAASELRTSAGGTKFLPKKKLVLPIWEHHQLAV